MSELRETAMTSKAWPFEEARRLLKRYRQGAPEKGYVLRNEGINRIAIPPLSLNRSIYNDKGRRAYPRVTKPCAWEIRSVNSMKPPPNPLLFDLKSGTADQTN